MSLKKNQFFFFFFFENQYCTFIKGGQKDQPVIQMSYLVEHFPFRLEIERQT